MNRGGRKLSQPIASLGMMALLVVIFLPLEAQDSLRIRQPQLVIDQDSLRGHWGLIGLNNEEISNTLLTGLPILVEMEPQLLREEKAAVPLPKTRYQCQYDIWEDVYIIETENQTVRVASMNDFFDWWRQAPPFTIFAVEDLGQSIQLRLQVKVAVTLLTRKQDRQLRSWVLNRSQKEETLPSSQRDTGFTLDLNALLTIFIDREAPLPTFHREATSPKLFIPQAQDRQ